MNRCPDCGKEVYLKEGKYGLFFGCSGFPDCRFSVGGDFAYENDFFDDKVYEEYLFESELRGFLNGEYLNG